MYVFACHSSYILSLCRQWLRDNLLGRFFVFGVWEPQARQALHLHLVVMSNDGDGLEYVLASFQSMWRKWLLDLSTATGVDLFEKNESKTWKDDPTKPRCDAQWLRKDPAKYMGKYCGKEAGNIQAKATFPPARWVTVDRQTAKEAISERVRIVLGGWDPALARHVWDNLLDLAEPVAENWFSYDNPVYAEDITQVLYFTDIEATRFVYAAWKAVQFITGVKKDS
jgi:hypothetical protein